ncbi:MAG: cyclic nucleotide-binding domain-containing protein [Deltaproteobacteria bacterium]|nr:cyclic nucleotide-binding domain-containing protein [Deltaproteobacteria bacterium]
MADPSRPVVQVQIKRLTLAEFIAQDPLLETSLLLKAVPGALRQEFLSKAALKRLGKGASIYRIGEISGPLYLVLKGEVALENAKGVESHRALKGEFFGESEIVDPSPARRGNAVAATDLDFAEFSAEYVASLLKRIPGLRGVLGETDAGRRQADGELDDFLNRW